MRLARVVAPRRYRNFDDSVPLNIYSEHIEMIEKNYNPTQVESRWYKFWTEKGYFKADETSSKQPFSIVIPPLLFVYTLLYITKRINQND